MTPNGASAAGYYQITHGTWLANGGGKFAERADLATKAEQDIVAGRIHKAAGDYGDWQPSYHCSGIA